MLVNCSIKMSKGDAPLSRCGPANINIELYNQDSWTVVHMNQNDPVEVPAPECRSSPMTSEASAFWSRFPPFVPRPRAPFLVEFGRLVDQEGWSKTTKRRYLVEALNSEIDFHSDTTSGLARWQRLCNDFELSSKAISNTKCKSVCPAIFFSFQEKISAKTPGKVLRSRFVNLYTLVDYRRNPDVPLVYFNSYRELVHDIRKTGHFPRQCAKQDGYIKIFLKKM
ncbi:hypothetical protein ACJBU6_11298 [Exserohilum turcicum]